MTTRPQGRPLRPPFPSVHAPPRRRAGGRRIGLDSRGHPVPHSPPGRGIRRDAPSLHRVRGSGWHRRVSQPAAVHPHGDRTGAAWLVLAPGVAGSGAVVAYGGTASVLGCCGARRGAERPPRQHHRSRRRRGPDAAHPGTRRARSRTCAPAPSVRSGTLPRRTDPVRAWATGPAYCQERFGVLASPIRRRSRHGPGLCTWSCSTGTLSRATGYWPAAAAIREALLAGDATLRIDALSGPPSALRAPVHAVRVPQSSIARPHAGGCGGHPRRSDRQPAPAALSAQPDAAEGVSPDTGGPGPTRGGAGWPAAVDLIELLRTATLRRSDAQSLIRLDQPRVVAPQTWSEASHPHRGLARAPHLSRRVLGRVHRPPAGGLRRGVRRSRRGTCRGPPPHRLSPGPLVGVGRRGARGRPRVGPPQVRGLSSEPMRLSFHRRILLILICLGAVPTAVAILGWGITIRSATPAAGPRQALEEVGATGRVLLRTLDSTDLAPEREGGALGACGDAQHRDRTVPARGDLRPLLLRRPGLRGLRARRRGALRLGQTRRPPVAPTEPADRGADRLDRPHPTDGAAARRQPPARGTGVRRAADGAPGNGRRDRARTGPGDRGGAAAGIPGDRAARGARDAKPADADSAGRRAARSFPDAGHAGGDRGAYRGVGTAGAAGAGIHRVWTVARRTGGSGGSRRAGGGAGAHLDSDQHDRAAGARSRHAGPAADITIRCGGH